MPAGTRRFSSMMLHRLMKLAMPLSLPLTLFASAGCKPDICLDSNLTAEQRCRDCKPRDDLLLARLNPTPLTFPVRKAVEQCADRIHDNDQRGFVTKQALRECTNNAPGLDNNTKLALAEIINRS